MAQLSGVYHTTKKDGSDSYRASITYQSKHISLGSYAAKESAASAYHAAKHIFYSGNLYTPEDYEQFKDFLPIKKWITLLNFKNNNLYIKTPIYLMKNFFYYYLSQDDRLMFDIDDLFFYSTHSIMRRGNHLFVADYGMQVNIASRYGIKNFARPGIDFEFVNGDSKDFRYENIRIFNTYHGVTPIQKNDITNYAAKIHVNGDYLIGYFSTKEKAAIAYNKAADYLASIGHTKAYPRNFIECYSSLKYQTIYNKISLPEKILQLFLS